MNALSHELAVKNHAVEGYVLGDLKDIERQAFERHMATCSVCTLEARYAAGLVMGLQEALQEEFSPPLIDERRMSVCRKFLRRILYKRM